MLMETDRPRRTGRKRLQLEMEMAAQVSRVEETMLPQIIRANLVIAIENSTLLPKLIIQAN